MEKIKTPKNVLAMGFVSLFNDIASEMIYFIVPIFLTSVLNAPATIVGLIEGIAESTASFLKSASGWVSDKFAKRKPLVVFGYSISSLSKIILAFARVWEIVLVGRFIDKVGKGIRTAPRDALIVESAPPEQMGRAFGVHRALDSLGAVIGPLITMLILFFWKENYPIIFLAAAIPGIVGVIILIIFVKEGQKSLSSKKFTFSIKDLTPSFKMFLLINIIFALGNSSDAFLILRSKNLGMSTILVTLAYVIYNLSYSIFSVPAGIVSDKIGPKKVMTIGFIVYAFVYFMFGIINKSFYVWLLFPIYGIYIALTDGVSKAYITKFVPREKSGTAFGVFQMLIGFCSFPASLTAGILWDKVGTHAPFAFGGVMALVAALLLIPFGAKQEISK